MAALLVVGLGSLAMGALLLFQERLRTLPPGPTAGGAATPADMCRRGLPPDMVESCLAEQRRQSAAAGQGALVWAGIGVCCLAAAGLLRRRSARAMSAASNVASA